MRLAYEEGVAKRAAVDLGLPWAVVRQYARNLNPYPSSSYAGRMWRRGFLAKPAWREGEPA